jgi:putative MATE family efflux protein
MSSERTLGRVSLTEGRIGRSIVLFALPLFGSSLVQQLYATVDMMYVGRLLGNAASVAVGCSSLLTTLIIGFFNGMGVGVSVLAARHFGAGDHEKLDKTVCTAAWLSIVGALLLTVIGLAAAPHFLRWLNTPDEALGLAVLYFRCYLLSLPAIVFYNISSGILRALGNSHEPMVFQLIGGIVNVVGNTLLMVLLPWLLFGDYTSHVTFGIVAVAVATLLAQTVAAALSVRRLVVMEAPYGLKIGGIRNDRHIGREIFAIGIPAAVQAMVITLSNLIVQAQINSLDVASIAAFTAYFKVETFIYLPIVALGQANTTFFSQNLGAGNPARSRQGTAATIRIGVVVTVCIAALMLLFSDFFFGMFNKDPEVIALGRSIARVTIPLYFFYVFLEVFSAAIRGAGKALPPMIITLVNMCLIRIIILLVIMRFAPTVMSVAAIYPITWALTAISLFVYYKKGNWLPA